MNTKDEGVIYEVTLDVDPDVVTSFDDWLREHIREMLVLPGFESAQLFSRDPDPADPEESRAQRTVQYKLSTTEELRHYFEQHAERMRKEGTDRFGGKFKASRRILNAPTEFAGTGEHALHFCLNCNAPLAGQYCTDCGQRDKSRMISLWELLKDLVGDVFELDSRIWRTLRPLTFRPGFLTNEYLAGRRMHYTPPLRLYLVLSILFFLLLPTSTTVSIDGDGEESEVAGELGLSPDESCSDVEIDLGGRLEGFEPLARDWAYALCIKGEQVQRNPAVFRNELLGNLPKMMFLFLPLLALVMKFLYPWSKRYYVEHLLFFVHFHSYFFLALTITILYGLLPDFFPGQGVAGGILIAIVSIWTPFYLARAMRNVYGQMWIVRFAKYLVLVVAYVISFVITAAVGALFTLLTV